MSVIAMKVTRAEPHANADALRLYTMKVPGKDDVQIVANLENIYQVDDIVAVALIGSLLKDGTKIKLSKLRGIYSYGMALGKVSAEIGDDVSKEYCQQEIVTISSEEKLSFQKWTSIELLYNVRRSLDILESKIQITYRAKIKLHGTNAGVQVTTDGFVAAQKRSQIITSQSDNAGFAAWVEANIDYFSALKNTENTTIFGEWCGSGVQKGVAISQLDRKIFAVFAIQFGDDIISPRKLEIRPDKIRKFLPEHKDVFVIPFYGEPLTIDFGNKEQIQSVAETINKMVEDVEKIDPWVKDTFDIEGIGEGLVMYPETDKLIERTNYTQYLFKAKGLKHQAVKSKKAVSIDPELVKTIAEFVDIFVTESRLEQGLAEACNGELDMKKMGDFLKWFAHDVHKESVAELEAAGLTWKEVNKHIMTNARKWYQDRVINF